MFETGTAAHSAHRITPPLHIVVRTLGSRHGWVTWCGGGAAYKGEVTPRNRRCRYCVALARRDIEENCEPHEASEFDWYLGREPRLTDPEAAP